MDKNTLTQGNLAMFMQNIDWIPIENISSSTGKRLATHYGFFELNGFKFKAYKLEDGKCVIQSRDIINYLAITLKCTTDNVLTTIESFNKNKVATS